MSTCSLKSTWNVNSLLPSWFAGRFLKLAASGVAVVSLSRIVLVAAASSISALEALLSVSIGASSFSSLVSSLIVTDTVMEVSLAFRVSVRSSRCSPRRLSPSRCRSRVDRHGLIARRIELDDEVDRRVVSLGRLAVADGQLARIARVFVLWPRDRSRRRHLGQLRSLRGADASRVARSVRHQREGHLLVARWASGRRCRRDPARLPCGLGPTRASRR